MSKLAIGNVTHAILETIDSLLDQAYQDGVEYKVPAGSSGPNTAYLDALIPGYAGLTAAIKLLAKSAYKAPLAAFFDPPAWTESLLQGGTPATTNWLNYGGGYNTSGYYRDVLSGVHLKGLVKASGTSVGSGSGQIMQLPVGNRPGMQLLVICQGFSGGVYVPCRVDITTGGAVSLTNPTSITDWVSLDNIHFRAEA